MGFKAPQGSLKHDIWFLNNFQFFYDGPMTGGEGRGPKNEFYFMTSLLDGPLGENTKNGFFQRFATKDLLSLQLWKDSAFNSNTVPAALV